MYGSRCKVQGARFKVQGLLRRNEELCRSINPVNPDSDKGKERAGV